MSRSESEKRINVSVSTLGTSILPGFVELATRHLEKEGGEGVEWPDGSKVYPVPLDLLRMTGGPRVADEIEEVLVGFKKTS